MAPSTTSTNPFQQITGSSAPINEWTTLLNGVKASSTKATPSTSYSPNGTSEGSADLFISYERGSNGVVVTGDSSYEERLQVSRSV